MNRWIGLLAVAVGLGLTAVAGVSAAEDRPAVVITPGQGRAFHAAVQVFRDDTEPADAQRARQFREQVGQGLEYSSVILPLHENAFLGALVTEALASGRRPDCADWAQGGADALVEGVLRQEGMRVSVEYQVWDTARCVSLARARIARSELELSLLARLVADAVVGAFTGSPGVSATELAFVSDRGGEREIFVMDADGGRQRAATRGASIKAFPDWMPDGKAILYTSYQSRNQPGLFLTSRGEVRAGQILESVLPGLPKYRGVFDPSGEHLAMVVSYDGSSEIYRVNRSGRQLEKLTSNAAIDISPCWSPDGERIAFVSDRSGSPQVYVMRRDGSDLRRVTFNGSYNTGPAWSPDGRWIAYETRMEGGLFDIWLIDPEGQTNVPLVTHARSDESPEWSPDGRKVAFASTRRGPADIYVIDLGGENVRRLTAQQGNNLQPAWGPFPR